MIDLNMLYKILVVCEEQDLPEDQYPLLVVGPENFIYLTGDFYPEDSRSHPEMISALFFGKLTVQTNRKNLIAYIRRVTGYQKLARPKPEVEVYGGEKGQSRVNQCAGRSFWF